MRSNLRLAVQMRAPIVWLLALITDAGVSDEDGLISWKNDKCADVESPFGDV